MTTTESLYQKFREMGYDHQEARELALKTMELKRAAEFNPDKLEALLKP